MRQRHKRNLVICQIILSANKSRLMANTIQKQTENKAKYLANTRLQHF